MIKGITKQWFYMTILLALLDPNTKASNNISTHTRCSVTNVNILSGCPSHSSASEHFWLPAPGRPSLTAEHMGREEIWDQCPPFLPRCCLLLPLPKPESALQWRNHHGDQWEIAQKYRSLMSNIHQVLSKWWLLLLLFIWAWILMIHLFLLGAGHGFTHSHSLLNIQHACSGMDKSALDGGYPLREQ